MFIVKLYCKEISTLEKIMKIASKQNGHIFDIKNNTVYMGVYQYDKKSGEVENNLEAEASLLFNLSNNSLYTISYVSDELLKFLTQNLPAYKKNIETLDDVILNGYTKEEDIPYYEDRYQKYKDLINTIYRLNKKDIK